MKKTLLLFLLLPFFGFSQIDLLKWDAASSSNRSTPTNIVSTVAGQNITSNGASLAYVYNNDDNVFFQSGSWPTPADNGGEYNPAKYVQFAIKPNTGYKTDLSTFTFECRSGSGKFRVKYSKDATFATGVKDLITPTASPSSWTTYSPSFSSEINPVLDNETVYIRFYSYSTNNTFEIKTGTKSTNVVPLLRGTVTNFDSTKILAVNDYVDTKKELGVNINLLNNDVKKANVTSLVISTPPTAAMGSAIINPDKTITFNPAVGFTGAATFSYTISNATETSTATVKVTVSDNTDDTLSLWNGASNSYNPVTNAYVNSNAPVTTVGASLSYQYQNTTTAFFQTGSWPTPQQNGGSLDLNKYIQFKISPDSNHQLNLKQFNFTYRGAGSQKFQVRYSKDVNFVTGVKVLIAETTSATSWTTLTNTLASDINPVLSNETVYIRFYVYNTNNTFEIKNGNGNSEGPAITGTVKDVNTLTANDDAISTPSNVAVVIPILTNDVIGGSALQAITVTQPSNGTVTVNGTTNITFTPASNFTGAASFTYTLRNANSNYSSATVNVNGTAPICAATPTAGINYWKGFVYTYTGNTPAATTYVGSIAEKAIFDRNIDQGTITGDTTVEANNFCGTAPSDKFLVRYLMQTTVATTETYNFTIGSDDGIRLYIDGVLVTTTPTNSWSDHSYFTYAAQYSLTAGTHNFILEYYENAGGSRLSFSYGAIKGDTTFPYGDNKWNVYGFSLADLSLPPASYAGYYVDTNPNINTQAFWNKTKSPSYYAGWQGAPIGVDQYTITYKRQGFPCGRYQIQLVNCDDVAEIYIDGTKIFTQNGYTNATSLINGGQTYPLNKNSKVEVRLREDGGDANVAFNFIDAPFVYDGSTNTIPTGSSITVNNDLTLTGNLEVCSCTIAANKTFTIPADMTLTVNESIVVNTNGKLVVKNNGSLIETNNNATYTGAADSFQIERISTAMKNFDYTYWSSPVVGQKLKTLSPNTLSDKYMSFSGVNWVVENSNNTMKTGKGYIIRVPKPNSTYSNGKDYWTGTTYEQPVNFIGVPNNGIITGEALTANTYQLIGNPYPSALDANAFLSNVNNSFLEGTIYFWTHNTVYTNNKYTSDDYASYNRLGGLATSKAESAKNGGANTNTPAGKIAAGQSFFAVTKAAGSAYFNNSMRIIGNSQFFKTTATEKHRVWLNLTNDEGAFKQTLVGYIDGATNGYDSAFDGVSFNQNAYINFYSINDGTTTLAIQGRALPLDDSDIVPLGYSSTIKGDFTIAIDNADGDLASKSIFLEDKTLGTMTDLSKTDYKFTTAAGTFNERFALRYTNKTLGTGDFENKEEAVLVGVQNKTITINSTKENIDTVYIYDISGKLLYTKKKVGDTQVTITNLGISQQVIFVKIILDNDHVETVKSMFR
ncbi:Ig-like domain-containing protein [Flavobacterium sp. N1736]|uniref:Ig-like domain-containing protein n=1 Tax=Flavobacterium sp. N1736 TaxID=2986823 RepID=UPI0022247BD9|nr:Ig-like domain-containing protein [Flavobacterium sp. N1736]